MDPADQTILTPHAGDTFFAYSEGDDIERYLHHVLLQAGDLSTGSQELVDHMRDWPTTYHLSPQRADLLRLVAPLLRGKILEVGSGCGAISRFLGETGATVRGLEGSASRAALARLRIRGLHNVTIDVGNFETQAYTEKFDVGVLVGVLEYSRKYVQQPNPVHYVLDKMRQLLTPEGVMVLAIENQLGLKYFAGAPEDHQGSPFFGMHDLYDKDTAVTFGKAELTDVLHQAGFKHTQFLYPFPDYKLPHVMLTERGARAPVGMVAEILQGVASGSGQAPYARLFSEEASWPIVWRNGLVEDLANSFLVLASAKPIAPIYPEDRLATLYATRRRRPFCKQTHIDAVPKTTRRNTQKSRRGPHTVTIARERLYPLVASPKRLHMTLCREPAIAGMLLLTELTQLLNTPDWSATRLATWAAPWLAYLREQATADLLLPGRFLDCNPCNLIRRHDNGLLQPFDLEWDMSEMVSLPHVMLRGMGICLGRHQSVAAPQGDTSTNVLRLALDVLALMELRPSDADIGAYFAFETEFQFEVYGRRDTFFSGSTLQVRPTSWAAHLRQLQDRSDAHKRQEEQLSAAFQMAPEVLRAILEPVFDPEFYGAKYPDVLAARVDCLEHFINHGVREGRQPNAWFDAGYYLQLYPEVAALRMNPLAHYVLIGKHQKRLCGPVLPEIEPEDKPASDRESGAVKMARRLARSLLPRAAATD